MKFFGATGTAGFGGSYVDVGMTGSSKALIHAGAVITAASLKVDAYNETRTITIAESGGKADKFAFNASFAIVDIEHETLAQIDDGVTLMLGSTPVAGAANGESLLVLAQDKVQVLTIAGSVGISQDAAIGVSIAITEIDRDTQAVLGSLNIIAAELDR